ncbi:hypothetical protein SAY86_003329 [Trapa natans]|uniref:Uncharacterized protein n=1 Tax=Trapa natans TaxID=22666 RepID=A0AAN7MRW5_TRANT|nr:hypothetical protein SAY86_003329 [Trapa natans]
MEARRVTTHGESNSPCRDLTAQRKRRVATSCEGRVRVGGSETQEAKQNQPVLQCRFIPKAWDLKGIRSKRNQTAGFAEK